MTSQWIILRTAGRSTLKLADSLKQDGFEVWTPVEVVKPPLVRRQGIRAMVPRYVFAPGELADDLLRLSHGEHRHPKFNLVRLADRLARTSEAAIQQLRDAEAMTAPRKQMSPYTRGKRVRVTRGNFSGMNGIVDRSDGREAEVWMTMFGNHRRFTLPLYYLEEAELKKAA